MGVRLLMAADPKAGPPRGTWALSAALFILFVPLAISEELVDPARALPWVEENHRVAVLAVDGLLLLIVLGIRLVSGRLSGLGGPYWGWFVAGGALHLGLDYWVVGESAADRSKGALPFAAAAAYVVTLAMVAAALRPRPSAGFRLLLPLAAGTFAAYLGAEYHDILGAEFWADRETESLARAVDQQYFAQASQVIPLLLIAVGLEARQFERFARFLIGRATAIVAIFLLCLAEVMVLAALAVPRVDAEAESWYEYIAFIVSIDAIVVGLALLLWALIPKIRADPPTETPPSPATLDGPERVRPPEPAVAPARAVQEPPAKVGTAGTGGRQPSVHHAAAIAAATGLAVAAVLWRRRRRR